MLVLPTPWHSGRQLVPLLHLTLPLLGFSHNKPPGPETRRPRSISAAHHKHNSTASPLCCSSFLPLSCPLPQRLGRAVRVPTSPPSFLLHLQPIPAAPNHGGNGSAPSQPRRRGAHAHAAAPAPARLPRLLLSVRPASAAAARGVGRARDEGRGGEDGRGDHREVRARVRPLESKRGTVPTQAALTHPFHQVSSSPATCELSELRRVALSPWLHCRCSAPRTTRKEAARGRSRGRTRPRSSWQSTAARTWPPPSPSPSSPSPSATSSSAPASTCRTCSPR